MSDQGETKPSRRGDLLIIGLVLIAGPLVASWLWNHQPNRPSLSEAPASTLPEAQVRYKPQLAEWQQFRSHENQTGAQVEWIFLVDCVGCFQ